MVLSINFIFLCCMFFIPVAVGNKKGVMLGSNYQWALKILGGNDATYDHPSNVHLIFEIGSRDLLDGNYLAEHYNASVYSFEASPYNWHKMEGHNQDPRVQIVRSAVSKKEGTIEFWAAKNVDSGTSRGTGSLFKPDYVTNRSPADPDYNRTDTHALVTVNTTRLDSFIRNVSKKIPDMLCMDCQEAELQALQSAGEDLRKIKYIVFEAASVPVQTNGTCYRDIHMYLDSMGFKFLALKKQAGRKGNVRFTIPENYIVDQNDGADFVYINKHLNLLR